MSGKVYKNEQFELNLNDIQYVEKIKIGDFIQPKIRPDLFDDDGKNACAFLPLGLQNHPGFIIHLWGTKIYTTDSALLDAWYAFVEGDSDGESKGCSCETGRTA